MQQQPVIRCKVWFELDGLPIFGQGMAALIEAVAATGSLQQAARDLKMSYRNAWEKINKAENRLGKKLVQRQAGGSYGGGSELTPAGHHFLKLYKQLCHDVDTFAAERFHELLKGVC